MHFNSSFTLSYVSFRRAVWATGLDGSMFSLCKRTAFKLNCNESMMKNIHHSGLWSIPIADIKLSISWQVTRLSFFAKKEIKSLWRLWKVDSAKHAYRRFYCCSLEPNSSALLFDSSRSMPRSFNSFFCYSGWLVCLTCKIWISRCWWFSYILVSISVFILTLQAKSVRWDWNR